MSNAGLKYMLNTGLKYVLTPGLCPVPPPILFMQTAVGQLQKKGSFFVNYQTAPPISSRVQCLIMFVPYLP